MEPVRILFKMMATQMKSEMADGLKFIKKIMPVIAEIPYKGLEWN